MGNLIKVPDIPHPTSCWKQKLTPPYAMWRCTYEKGHDGMHSWEKCNHPLDQRWQYPATWLCCKCFQYFWGSKHTDNPVSLYGTQNKNR